MQAGIRRHLVGLAIVLMAVQALGRAVPAGDRCLAGRGAGVVCTCCRTGSAGQCPMCSRIRHASAGCSCQRHDTPLPSPLDVVAIVPEATPGYVDAATEASPPAPAHSPADITPVLPSPPPWSASAR